MARGRGRRKREVALAAPSSFFMAPTSLPDEVPWRTYDYLRARCPVCGMVADIENFEQGPWELEPFLQKLGGKVNGHGYNKYLNVTGTEADAMNEIVTAAVQRTIEYLIQEGMIEAPQGWDEPTDYGTPQYIEARNPYDEMPEIVRRTVASLPREERVSPPRLRLPRITVPTAPLLEESTGRLAPVIRRQTEALPESSTRIPITRRLSTQQGGVPEIEQPRPSRSTLRERPPTQSLPGPEAPRTQLQGPPSQRRLSTRPQRTALPQQPQRTALPPSSEE